MLTNKGEDGVQFIHGLSVNSRVATYLTLLEVKLSFDVHTSVHRKYVSKVQPTGCNVFSIYLFL
jgi:hypothetical protein